jgi:hypothetical protein
MLFKELLIYISIPLWSIFIRLCLQKWRITTKWINSNYKVLRHLGYCPLCFFTWCNLLCNLVYCFSISDYTFLGCTPAFIIISILIVREFELFDNE